MIDFDKLIYIYIYIYISCSWALAFLAQNPEVAEKVAREAAECSQYPPENRMRMMPFTQSVILETMRLRPPAYIVGRCTSRDDVPLGEYSLGKGTTVLISPYAIHRSAKYWSDADSFIPERWLSEEDIHETSSYDDDIILPSVIAGTAKDGAYMPFGAGQRNCVGALFAMMETTLIVGEVCKRYKLRLPRGTSLKPKPFVTLRPENDQMILTLKKR